LQLALRVGIVVRQQNSRDVRTLRGQRGPLWSRRVVPNPSTMELPTSLLALVVILAALLSLGFLRAGRQLRRMVPGRERETLATSLWSMGGSAAIVLSIAMGLPPLSLPLWPRMLVLGGAVGLVVTGGVKLRRLRRAREQELLQAGASAVTLADRIEALEGQRFKYRRIPLWVQLSLIGGEAVMAGSAFWALYRIRHGASLVVFGSVALAATAGLVWHVFDLFRRRAGRERIDAEVERLLDDAAPAISEIRHQGELAPDAEGAGGHP